MHCYTRARLTLRDVASCPSADDKKVEAEEVEVCEARKTGAAEEYARWLAVAVACFLKASSHDFMRHAQQHGQGRGEEGEGRGEGVAEAYYVLNQLCLRSGDRDSHEAVGGGKSELSATIEGYNSTNLSAALSSARQHGHGSQAAWEWQQWAVNVKEGHGLGCGCFGITKQRDLVG